VKPPVNDATTAFLRAIGVNFVNLAVVIEEVRSRAWASATFGGARHELGLHISGEGAEAAVERFAATLDAREFELRGHILADIALVAKERVEGGVRLRLEALTVEEC
jgi:hypothetical protein